MRLLLKKLSGAWPIALIIITAAWLVVACGQRNDHVRSYVGLTISEASIHEHVEQRMEELGIPGLSMAIVNGGEVVYSANHGDADVAAGLPVTDQTIFEGASLSKPVFAHFVMTFVEEGVLDLDRPLAEYLKHPDVGNDKRAELITARMVLSHRAGFPNWRDGAIDGPLPINFEPDTGFEYSGEGYQYLAMVLREITNTDWAGLEELFQRRIAEPLGLVRTVFIQTEETRRNKAEPYDEAANWIDWRNNPLNKAQEDVFVAPASIHSDAADFSRWMIGVMNRELLISESYDELFTVHSSAPSDDLGLSYTLGFYKPHLPFTDVYGHGGNNDGFTSFFMLDAEDDWAFVVFTNSEYGERFGEELFIYLLAGPNITKIGATIVSVLALGLSAIVLVIRAVRRYRRTADQTFRFQAPPIAGA